MEEDFLWFPSPQLPTAHTCYSNFTSCFYGHQQSWLLTIYVSLSLPFPRTLILFFFFKWCVLTIVKLKSQRDVSYKTLERDSLGDPVIKTPSFHFQAQVWSLFRELRGFPNGPVFKNPPTNAVDMGLILGSGRSPGERNGNPLQYSCLKSAMDREAWRAAVHVVTKSRIWLGDWASTGNQDPLSHVVWPKHRRQQQEKWGESLKIFVLRVKCKFGGKMVTRLLSAMGHLPGVTWGDRQATDYSAPPVRCLNQGAWGCCRLT